MKRKFERRESREGVVLLKDLAPRTDVKGGAGKILFGEGIHSAVRGGLAEIGERKAPPKPERK